MALARELRLRGHAVRGTTRDPARAAEIEAAGAEPFIADPDRVSSIVPALDHASVLCVLLASATGPPDAVKALHGPRLQMLLSKVLDTTVHGVAYEVRGSVPQDLLAAGDEAVRRACERSRIPYALLDGDPEDPAGWLRASVAALEGLLTEKG